MSNEKFVPDPQFPYRSTQEQREHSRSQLSSRTSRRRFLIAGGAAAALSTLVLTGKAEDFLASISREKKGPTDEQKEVYNHLVVERFDVITDLVLAGEPTLPSNLRNRPYTPRDYEKPVGDVISKIGKTIPVGDGFVVMGDDPSEQHRISNSDPWIAILNPLRDKSKAPRPEDVVFSHYGNFVLTNEQLIQVMKAAQRLAA
ncbi:MAG: hypothetical protein AAB512_03745 [Patescibacteria group bacterium]